MQRDEDTVADAMAKSGLRPGAIELDGKFHRFSTSGSRGDDAGWYRLVEVEGGRIVIYGDWRTGLSASVSLLDGSTSPRVQRAVLTAARKATREAEEQEHADAARLARQLFDAGGKPPADHPYLVKKRIDGNGMSVLDVKEVERIIHYPPKAKGTPLEGLLLIAPMQVDGKITTVEMIDVHGHKAALARGSKRGAYWTYSGFDDETPAIGLAEGVATAKSIEACSGELCVAVGSSSGFLVALEGLRKRCPGARLTVFSDRGNGYDKAREAAEKWGATLVAPPDDLVGTDFNDMVAERGPNAVTEYIRAALEPEGLVRFCDAASAPPPDFVLPGLVAGSLGMLVGQGAIGKSYFALECLTALALGHPVGGEGSPLVPPKSGRTGGIFGEDEPLMLYARMRSLAAARGYSGETLEKLDDMVQICSRVGADMRVEQFSFRDAAKGVFHDGLTRFCQGKRLVILDPMVMLHDGDERDNGQMGILMRDLLGIGRTTNCAIVLLHHIGKDNGERETWAAARGASSLTTTARWQLNMAPPSTKEVELYNLRDSLRETLQEGEEPVGNERERYVRCELAKHNYTGGGNDFWLFKNKDGVPSFVRVYKSANVNPLPDDRLAGSDAGWHPRAGGKRER